MVTNQAFDATRMVQAVVPANLNLYGVRHRADHDYARLIVSSVIRWRWTHSHDDPKSWSPISSTHANKCVPPKKRKRILDQLVDSGVLECDGSYFFRTRAEVMRATSDNPGAAVGKCLYYRLGKRYRNAEVRHLNLLHPEIYRKVSVARDNQRASVTDPVHVALRKWSDAIEFLPDMPRDNKKLAISHTLLAGQRWFTICPQGRVHTPATSLPKVCRPYLRLAGREMWSVDVSAAQPLILAQLCMRREASRPHPQQPEGKDQTPPTPQEALCSLSSDGGLSDFVRDCTSGVLYDRVMWNIPSQPYTRDVVKKRFLAVVYANDYRSMGTKVGKAVQSLYPAVYDTVLQTCRELGPGGLPRLMQREESRLMIHGVAARLLRERPESSAKSGTRPPASLRM